MKSSTVAHSSKPMNSGTVAQSSISMNSGTVAHSSKTRRSASSPIETAIIPKAEDSRGNGRSGQQQQQKQDGRTSSDSSLPWKEMFQGAAQQCSTQNEQKPPNCGPKPPCDSNTGPKTEERHVYEGRISGNPEVRLALYIAMAHGGLILSLAALYGVGKLLEEYWRPIQWAILCSMPLREVQGALVEFWSYPLRLGLVETVLALPVAVYSAMAGTLQDLRAGIFGMARKGEEKNRVVPGQSHGLVGFSKLLRWLLSFGLFVLSYERLGAAALAGFALLGFMLYAAGRTAGLQDLNPGQANVASTLSVIAVARRSRIRRAGGSRPSIWSRANRYLTGCVLKRLHTLIAVWLITMMIAGSLAGVLFFSYKIGLEGKDAVVSLKIHVQRSNYAERIGLKQWIVDNNIPELMDTYTVKFYETVSHQIDAIALQYNMTEVANSFKHYLIKRTDSSSPSAPEVPPHPLAEKLQNVRLKARNWDFRGIYADLEMIFRELQVSREDLVGKAKGFAVQSLDVAKQVFASSTLLLAGSTNFLFSVGLSIASGAAGVVNFLSQSMVFFWLLYYLITSESGGVMDHVLGMLPVSSSTRNRCANVLDRAVSSVLLATAKVAFFQAALTWLLFRLFQIHFLYMSTFLAFTSAVLPIFPPWLSSVPAGVQLAVEGRYVQAIVLTLTHLWVMDYGVTTIQDDVPGQNAYLTGLSILGGMALFPSALEGAIMGPLIMTVLMALKNLYSEFVLAAAKEPSS